MVRIENLFLNPLKTKFHRDLQASKFLLVRHAESLFNHKIHTFDSIATNKDSSDYKNQKNKIRFSKDLIDCVITENGKIQCKTAATQLKDLDISHIIVSPMKRALMTAHFILEELKMLKSSTNPKIIVHSHLFEKIEDNCDLLSDINNHKKEFSHYGWGIFDNFDDHLYYQTKFCDVLLENLALDKTNYYYSQIREKHTSSKDKSFNHHDYILDVMLKLSDKGKYIESSTKTFERLNIVKDFLTKFENENNILAKNKESKVLVIGHSILFKHLTAEYVNEDTLEPNENSYVLKNCEIVSLKL